MSLLFIRCGKKKSILNLLQETFGHSNKKLELQWADVRKLRSNVCIRRVKKKLFIAANKTFGEH